MVKEHFSDWASFEAYLEKLGFFRMELGLERIGAVLDKLRLRRLDCPTVQVSGTNGKGSTCTFLCSLARAHGRKAMLHSSPHFVSVRERVRVFEPSGSPWGDPLPEAVWLEAARAAMRAGGEKLTYFELITVMAVWLMRTEGAELAVLESGLGGAWDAGTAMEADIAVFTPIGLDHCAVLGGTVAEIARDKAGAMRREKPAVSAAQTAEARLELEKSAREKNARLIFASPQDLPEELRDGLKLGLKGAHQLVNAALALQVWRLAAQTPGQAENPRAVRRGLEEARIPGRMQFIQPAPHSRLPHPPLILDGAHNAHALAALGHSLAALGIAPAVIIFNCMRDKEPAALVPHLRVLCTGQIFVPEIKDNPRAMPAAETAGLIGLAAEPVRDISEAIRLASLSMNERLPEERGLNAFAHRHPLLICGSLYLLGEFFALYPQYLTKDAT